MSYYVHHVPGRIRVRIPVIRENPYKADEIRNLLDLDGVEKVEINHLTGSIVVKYNPGMLDSKSLLCALSEKGYFDDREAITCDDQIRKVSKVAAAKAGRLFFGWAIGKALESSGLSLLAAFI
jgi:Heavy metal associated domain 2